MNYHPDSAGSVSCYRHVDRRAGVICQRCDRPICADCMHAASVGFHCPHCVANTRQRVVFSLGFSPNVTFALLGLNVLIFFLSIVTGQRLQADYLLWDGYVVNGEWYRLLTAGFLHSDILHLAFNCFALWILGRSLEQFLGRARFITLYLVSILGGSFGVLLLEPNVAVVGASGGIFGLFGAMVVAQRSLGVNIWSSGLGPVLAINLFITFSVPTISVGGHLGGLFAGGVVAFIFLAATKARLSDWLAVGSASFFGFCLALMSIFLASNPLF